MRLFFAILLFVCSFDSALGRHPNVVFILVDDWGITDAGVQGSDFFETPIIDRFAEQSLRFTQAYAASPVCSPTRAAIMTGKSPARLDMTIWHEGAIDGGPRDRRLLNAAAEANLAREEFTLAELFKQSGYYTAHIGKWHLGNAAYYPETQGFDLNVGGTYWGAPVSFFYPYRGVWSRNDPELRYVPAGPGKPGDYLTDRLTDHAVQVIEDHQKEPFFLSLWFHTVHTPIQGRPELTERFRRKPAGQNHSHPEYAAMVASLDENVGRILAALDNAGLTDNTIVVLTSDNGGFDIPSRKSGNMAPTNNAPYRSGKGTLYEGGIRVPLMIRWPGRTEPGTVSSELVTSQDFLPTFADAMNHEIDPAISLDGVSLGPVLDDHSAPLEPRPLYWHYPHYYPRMTPGSAVRDGDWKLIHYYEDNRVELFDLVADPGERRDLADEEPDRVATLRTLLDDWRDATEANEPTTNADWHQPP